MVNVHFSSGNDVVKSVSQPSSQSVYPWNKLFRSVIQLVKNYMGNIVTSCSVNDPVKSVSQQSIQSFCHTNNWSVILSDKFSFKLLGLNMTLVTQQASEVC